MTVVECLSACDTAGFQLRSVEAVVHTGSNESGTDTSATAWTNLDQVLLMGGFNGAGCTTAETTDRDHPVCHARLFPSGTDTITWTRDGSNGSVNLTAATSTVMVVQWGSEWSVQRVNLTGSNGGAGLNGTNEYNTTAISSVTRGNTWVWGTGHAGGQGIGDQGEGVAYTLGDGVNQNTDETTVAAGTEYNGTAIDFEIYVMSHPSLAVDYRFKADGDSGSATVDVAVDTAGGQRMAVVSNGQDSTGDNYPRPLFSARYLNDTTVRLERQRTGSEFPAWVEGIDFTGIVSLSNPTGHDPAGLVVAGDGVTLGPSGTIEVIFQVVVDPDLDPATTPQILNTATLDTDQEATLQASVTDDVVEVGVIVEYDNAGFDLAGQTVIYTHEVVNIGSANDSFDDHLRKRGGVGRRAHRPRNRCGDRHRYRR